jgi:zinc protease
MTTLSASVVAGGETAALEALLEERARAVEHGFLESELDRTRRDMLAGIEASYAERAKAPSAAYAAEYVRHVLQNEPIPGIEHEVVLWRDYLPTVDVRACDEMLRSLFEADGIVLEASRNSEAAGASEEEMRAILRRAAEIETDAYVDRVVGESLLGESRAPGTIVKRREHADVGVTEFALSNGVRVFVKGTDFQDDDVRFLSVASGGTSIVADEDLPSAAIALGLAQESGWGGHSAVDLGRMLTGKVASASPYASDRRHGISGSSTIADFPTALELAVLEMGAPNRDPTAHARLMRRLRAQLENRESDPNTLYQDRLVAINTADHPRTRPMTLERLDEIDSEVALACYARWFANPADFAFFVVGNVDADALGPVLERTLGSIPASSAKPSRFVDRKVRFAKKTVRETVRAGSEPKSVTTITIGSYDGDDPREWHRLRSAASILDRRLRERLREDLGATYGVSVWYDHDILGRDDGTVTVRFGCDPQDAERLGREVFEALETLRKDGPDESEVAKEREIQTRELETALRQNGFWIGSLSNLWIRGRDFDEMSTRQTRIDELNRDELHRVFRQSFGPDPHTWVDLEPAAVAQPAAP